MHDGSITLRCYNDLEELETLQHMVAQFCALHGVPRRYQHAFALAIDEAVTNIIRHAYEDAARHEITLEVSVAGDQLSARIEDDGREFDFRSHPGVDCTRPIEQREAGGLGIHLIRSLVNRVSYERAGQQNILTLSKRLR